MKFRLWPRREPAEPVAEDEVPPPAETVSPEPEPAPVAPAPVEMSPPPPAPDPMPEPAPAVEAAVEMEMEMEVPTKVTLTIDEAKGAIRDAGGDVIQVGFLASAYRRHLQEDPGSAETAASRKRLRELVGKRLKDRGLLATDGVVELRD